MFTLVTGATSDIGRQICATLEASGHSLLMTDLDEGALLEARSGLQHPEKHRIVPIDLSGVERAGELLSDYLVREQLPVSHAVFAAGLFAVKPLRMADYAFVKRSFDVALFSAVELTRVLTFKKANADHLQGIVLISSVSALVGTKGYAVYGPRVCGSMRSFRAASTRKRPTFYIKCKRPPIPGICWEKDGRPMSRTWWTSFFPTSHAG